MVSGDHFMCDSCNYEWRTRKDVGEPSVCPHCKNTCINNESESERTYGAEF
jgi:predicted Zn-ribbon and HTH transcriptional regulator